MTDPHDAGPLDTVDIGRLIELAEAALTQAREARKVEDYAASMRHYRTALDYTRSMPMGESAHLTALSAFELLGLLLETDDVDGQREAYVTGVESAVAAGTPEALELATKIALMFGSARYEAEAIEEAERCLTRAAQLGEQCGTVSALSIATHATRLLMREDLGWEALRDLADRTIALGKRSGTPEGLEVAADAAMGAAVLARSAEAPSVERYLQLAVSLGVRSRTPDGLETAARCTQSLIQVLGQQWSPRRRRRALFGVIVTAVRLGTPYGKELAAKMALDLAVQYLHARRRWRARFSLRIAYHLGLASKSPAGLEMAVSARFRLASHGASLTPAFFRGREARRRAAEEGYRDAINIAKASQTEAALEFATMSANNLGASLTASASIQAAWAAYAEALDLAAASGTPDALEFGSTAAANLAKNLVAHGKFDEAHAAYQKGIELGRQSGTMGGRTNAGEMADALARDRDDAASAASIVTKGVIVVHGMGQPRRNSLLVKVVDQVADWLERNVQVRGRSHVPQVTLDLHQDARSFVTITHGACQWTFTEAYWAPTVETPLFNPTAGWVVSRFLFHLSRLCRAALVESLFPALTVVGAVALRVLYALLFVPYLLMVLPIAPWLVSLIRELLNRLYRAAIQAIPEADDPDALQQAADVAIRQWRKRGPLVIAGLFGSVPLAAAALAALFLDLSLWPWLVIGAAVGMTFLVTRNLASRIAVNPEDCGTPLAILVIQGVRLSKYGYLQRRIPRLRATSIYRDTLHNVVTGPATAVIRGSRRWLRANKEEALLHLLDWDRHQGSTGSRLMLGCALLALIGFRLLNSIFAVALYGIGALLIFPVMFVLWALTAFSMVPGVPTIVTFVKSRLDVFLLGSLGDIKVYLEEVTQATRARRELEEAIDALKERVGEIVIVAHSLGSAISYETLVIPQNEERVKAVRTLFTIGGILPMVWRLRSRRPAFDRPLPSHVRWVNVWSRLDPADPGPISPARQRLVKPDRSADPAGVADDDDRLSVSALPDPRPGGFSEIVVSNEDDLVRDHTSYWDNPHEVTPLLVREIWGAGASEATGHFQEEEGHRVLRRRFQILALSGPRLVAWYVLPVVFAALLAAVNASSDPWAFVPPSSESMLALLDAWGLSRLAGWPLIDRLVAAGAARTDFVLAALAASALVTLVAQLLYGFMRSVLWNGFFKELDMFNPTVPVRERSARVVRMEDGTAAPIVAIMTGRGFRV